MKYEKPEYLEDAPVFENNYIEGRQNEIKKALNPQGFFSRGRGDRTPINGFGDRRTTIVLFPYMLLFVVFLTNGYEYNTSIFTLQVEK